MTTHSVQPQTRPRVSVVIPTYHRPELVTEAVRSALDQSFRDLEVVVVIDGLDMESVSQLERIDDDRLRLIVPQRRLGNAGARNAGLAAARAPWIALLDDDDVWFADKLKHQMEAAERATARYPVIACRFLARSDTDEFLWPRRLPRNGQSMGDYLFRRYRPSSGDGVVQTSTIVAPAELFAKVRFDAGCSRFVDQDWLLRASKVPGTELTFAAPEEALSVWRMDDRTRISNRGDWRDDVIWMRDRRGLVSSSAYASFMLTLPSIRAARSGDRAAFVALLREALSVGRPGWAELTFHVGNFAFGPSMRERLARLSAGRHAPQRH